MEHILGYITWDIDPEMVNLFGKFSVRYYSLLFGTGFLTGYLLVKHLFEKAEISVELLESLFVYVFLGTLIGARIGHCLFYEPGYYLSRPWEMLLPFNFNNGFTFTGFLGLASHGGILGVFLAILYFSRKYKLDFLKLLDIISIGGALAGVFIRLANFMNSEIIGKATNSDFGVIFKQVDDVVRHPAQLYESFAYLLICITLYILYTKKGDRFGSGFIFGLFFSLLFMARFVIEFFKENQVGFEDQMTFNMGQLLSVPFFLFGLYMMYRGWKKPNPKI